MYLNFANKIKKLDIVNPEMLNIEGRCYRNLQSHDGIVSFSNNIYSASTELCLCEDEDLDIFQLSNDQYQLPLTIPRSSHHKIIGHLGKTLSKLRTDSGCQIEIPKLQEELDTVVISGTSRRAIKSVKNRIEMILSRPSRVYDIPDVTHFISIPISSYEIFDRLGEFKRYIMETSDIGIDESIFQDPNKLHLTICTLNLQSKEDLSNALGIFTTQVRYILDNSISEEAIIRLKGTECMNDDPSDVHVLYALAEMFGSNITLQTLCDQVRYVSWSILYYNSKYCIMEYVCMYI